MRADSKWLVCKWLPPWRAFAVLLLLGKTLAVAQEAAYGTLVLQSPVQAVATINGEGAYLLVPGQDLRWSRMRPGSYQVVVRGGGRQWRRKVQVQPGKTQTLVASVSSAGVPLAAGVAPPLPTGGSAHAPAYVPPPEPPPAGPLSIQPEIITQPRKEEKKVDRRREQERLRQQREDHAAEQRMREAEARALREAQRRERKRQKEEQNKQKKRRRPKVH